MRITPKMKRKTRGLLLLKGDAIGLSSLPGITRFFLFINPSQLYYNSSLFLTLLIKFFSGLLSAFVATPKGNWTAFMISFTSIQIRAWNPFIICSQFGGAFLQIVWWLYWWHFKAISRTHRPLQFPFIPFSSHSVNSHQWWWVITIITMMVIDNWGAGESWAGVAGDDWRRRELAEQSRELAGACREDWVRGRRGRRGSLIAYS